MSKKAKRLKKAILKGMHNFEFKKDIKETIDEYNKIGVKLGEYRYLVEEKGEEG